MKPEAAPCCPSKPAKTCELCARRISDVAVDRVRHATVVDVSAILPAGTCPMFVGQAVAKAMPVRHVRAVPLPSQVRSAA